MRKIKLIVTGLILASFIFLGMNRATAVVNKEDNQLVKQGNPDAMSLTGAPGIKLSKEKAKEPEYAPGELIVKLKEGKTLADIQDLNDKYNITSTGKVFKDTPADPKDTLKQLKDKLTKLGAEHESWYWQLDKNSKEYKDYVAKIDKEKQTLQGQIQAEEKLIAHLEQRQKRASEGATTPDLSNIYLLKTADKGTSMPLMASDYKANPAVEYAEPNHKNEIYMVPNDPYWLSSNSWGQGYDDLWGLKKIQADKAWDISQGEGVIVAVVDTGVDYNHEDITANIWINTREIPGNGKDDDNNGYIDDVRGYDFSDIDNDPIDYLGHGTHCSGTIAAVGNNSKGIIGVAPKAKIMPVKIFPNAYDTICAAGIKYAADNGADVLSNSWGPQVRLPSDPVIEAAIDYAYAKGCVIVFAAGNNNDDVAYYFGANHPNVITVAASDQNDQKCYFSNYGAKIDVTAPGGNGAPGPYNILSLLSTTHDASWDHYTVGSKYLRLGGTSMACPHVAGGVALLVKKWPDVTQNEILSILHSTSDDIDAIGFDDNSGYGRINLYKALTVSTPGTAIISSPHQGSYMRYVDTVSIKGTADSRSFDHYTLEIGKGVNPAIWTSISFSTSPVRNDVLGIWNTSGEEGWYTLRLTVVNRNGEVFISFSKFCTIKGLHEGWPRTYGYINLPATAEDLNNDGKKEIVFSFIYSGTGVVDHKGDYLSGWPIDWVTLAHQSGNDWATNPVVGDINGDGVSEIVAGARQWLIYAFNKDGSVVNGWPVDLGEGTYISDNILVDLDGDGTKEVVAGVVKVVLDVATGSFINSTSVYAWYGNGALVPGWPQLIFSKTLPLGISALSYLNLVSGDINNDGKIEIGVIADYGFDGSSVVAFFDPHGRLLSGWPIQFNDTTNQTGVAALGDINGDGLYELVFSRCQLDGYKKIYALKYDGTSLPDWPINVDFLTDDLGLLSYPTLGDLNNDGIPEVVCRGTVYSTQHFRIAAFQGNGSMLPGWPKEFEGGSPTSVLVSDVNGDFSPDLIVGARGVVYALDRNGNLLYGWPKIIPGIGICIHSLLLGDIDGDSKLELLAGGGMNSLLSLYDLDAALLNTATSEWAMFKHDPQHSGCYVTKAPATPIVNDEGTYTFSNSVLGVSWVLSNFGSGITEYQYRIIQDSPTGMVIRDWTSTGKTNNVTLTGLALQQGKTYYFTVKAKNGSGLWSAVGYSDGIKVDTTPPTTPVVTDSGAHTTNTAQLVASWSASDQESLVAEYQYQITQDSTTGTVIRVWTSTGKTNNVTLTGLALQQGKTYYFAVRAKNGAGLWSTVGYSDGIKVDTTAPLNYYLTAKQYTSSTNMLDAMWAFNDYESGITEYQYQITQDSTTGPVIKAWTSTGTTANVTLTGLVLQQGKTYYFAVKAKNGAGLWSNIFYSTGTKVDTTPPTTPAVADQGVYTTSASSLAASWWLVSDPESGVTEYQYKITQDSTTGTVIRVWTSTGKTNNVTLTGLALQQGKTYYFNVKAKNGAGLWSAVGYSDGIIVMLPPIAPSNLTATALPLSQIKLTWLDKSTNETGFKIERSLYATTGFTPIATVGANTTTYSNTGLSANKTYFYRVRAYNTAGDSTYSNTASATTLVR